MTVVDGTTDIMLITTDGIMIRFKTEDVSQTGRATMGVRLIKLGEGDSVASLTAVPNDDDDSEKRDENSKSEE